MKRHLKKGHETTENPECNGRDNMFNRRTDSSVHVHKFHEHDNDDEKGKNDEAKVKPNNRSIKKDGSVTSVIRV